MSQVVREALAAAANTVDGVNVTPYYRQATGVGEGLVRYDRTDYPNAFGGLVTWWVVVVLPQDMRAAEEWLDENGAALREAVAEELIVRSMYPQQLALTDGSAVLAVVIEGQREEAS
ncbi:hypothetical protein [Nocardioides sp. J54]|uniref:hypothetical protein n=1 Tax=Nocardioides sp. J54 TaxID=935866 RepID=UPI000561663E|nr:hypothetical protein [Nocardioides sp. J54]